MRICFVDIFVPNLDLNVSRLVATELAKLAKLTNDDNNHNHLTYVVNIESLNNAIDISYQNPYDVCFSTDQYCISDALKIKSRKYIAHIPDVPIWLLESNDPSDIGIKTDWNKFFKLILKFDHIVIHNKLTKDHLARYLVNKNFNLLPPTILIPYSIDIYTADSVSVLAERNQNKINKIEYQICMISAFSPHKHQEILLEAVRLLIEKNDKNDKLTNPIPIPKVILAGAGLSNKQKSELQQFANNYGIPLSIHGYISQQEKFEIIYQSMFGVYCQRTPYISGLFPIENFYLKKRCIMFDYPINMDQYEKYGIYVHTIREMSEQIYDLLTDDNKRKEGVDDSREWVKNTRTPVKHAENLYNLFNWLIN